MAGIAVRAEGTLVKIRVAARAIPVCFQELLIHVASDAVYVLMEREEAFRPMLELDISEWKTGRMALLAFFSEILVVRRSVAIVAVRFQLFFSVTGIAGQLRMSPDERKAGVCVLFDKRYP